MNEAKQHTVELSEREEIESLAQLIEEVQRTANKAVRRRGLKGDEFHALNILDIGLFGLCCQARIAASRFGKQGQAARPTIVCLCGSTRFMEAFQEANLRETLAGNIVLSVGCNTKSDREIFGDQNPYEAGKVKERLDDLHKRKIDLADEVLVLNVGNYIGESTRNEIAYAEAHGKPVRYLEPPS